MIKIFIIGLFVILASLNASADDYDNFNSDGESYENFNSTADDKYRDWKIVVRMLAAKGIESKSLDWKAIESGCKNERKQAHDIYNKCKYEKALNYAEYQDDKELCAAEAEQKYFDYIQSSGNSIVGDNSTINVEKSTPSLNKVKQKEFENSRISLCMRNLGWKGKGSWLAGKSED